MEFVKLINLGAGGAGIKLDSYRALKEAVMHLKQ